MNSIITPWVSRGCRKKWRPGMLTPVILRSAAEPLGRGPHVVDLPGQRVDARAPPAEMLMDVAVLTEGRQEQERVSAVPRHGVLRTLQPTDLVADRRALGEERDHGRPDLGPAEDPGEPARRGLGVLDRDRQAVHRPSGDHPHHAIPSQSHRSARRRRTGSTPGECPWQAHYRESGRAPKAREPAGGSVGCSGARPLDPLCPCSARWSWRRDWASASSAGPAAGRPVPYPDDRRRAAITRSPTRLGGGLGASQARVPGSTSDGPSGPNSTRASMTGRGTQGSVKSTAKGA